VLSSLLCLQDAETHLTTLASVARQTSLLTCGVGSIVHSLKLYISLLVTPRGTEAKEPTPARHGDELVDESAREVESSNIMLCASLLEVSGSVRLFHIRGRGTGSITDMSTCVTDVDVLDLADTPIGGFALT
jgi:hypothetical protein